MGFRVIQTASAGMGPGRLGDPRPVRLAWMADSPVAQYISAFVDKRCLTVRPSSGILVEYDLDIPDSCNAAINS
jgi:hypothetical protein